MPEVFLKALHLSKRYGGVTALADVDLTVHTGEVHCLVGENGSGKSTLVKIITGVVEPEPGAEIMIEGTRVRRLTPYEALRRGILVVHQDLSLFPNLSVAENIAIAQHIERGRHLVRWEAIRRIAREATEKIGVELPLEVPVGNLPVADQQLVAICRALASNARLLIMDEPTSSLTRREVDRLFGVVRELQEHGIATLFISHKLDEVLEIGQTITVLRDGRKVGTYARQNISRRELAYLMTGKEITYVKDLGQPNHTIVLTVSGLSKRGHYADISFCLRRGEILGIIGPLGSGRTELALSLFGMNPPDTGTILVDGRSLQARSNAEAIRHGIAYVPEDRLTQGLVPKQSVGNNLIITAFDRLRGPLGLIDRRRQAEFCLTAVRTFDIRAPSLKAPVRTLSGGNQQKTVIAKWLSIRPRILILDGPTIGIDVGARSTIYDMIHVLASQGVGIILISDDVPEVLHNCHRILLMKRGRIVAQFSSDEVSEEELYQHMTG
jgi:simple sugar transport system ATP-binding protein